MPDKKYYKLDDVGRIGIEDKRTERQIENQANDFSAYVRQAKEKPKKFVSIHTVLNRQGSMAKGTAVRSARSQTASAKISIKGQATFKAETVKQGKATSKNRH